MDETIIRAVRRVVSTIRENPGEELTIDDMARVAMFSKFHFSRIFRRATGLSPGRFLSAVRLQEAKELLLGTSLTVTDICNQVGYSAVGTFSTRFKYSVGISPIHYRENGGFRPMGPIYGNGNGLVSGNGNGLVSGNGGTRSSIRGNVFCPPDEMVGLVFIGLFPGPIPEGLPAYATVLDRTGPYELRDVSVGSWYLLAHSFPPPDDDTKFPLPGRRTPSIGRYGPIDVQPGVRRVINVRLMPVREFDPPILPALLDERWRPHGLTR